MDRMQAILLIGPTGSGKTPLGNWLASNGWHGRRCRHFDFGAHLRAGTGLTGEEQAFVTGLLARGGLLENEHFHIAEKILRAAVAGDEEALIILNGLPRHVGQARGLESLLSVIGVVVLAAGATTVLARLAHNSGGDRTGRMARRRPR
jgi:adenylate kinase family enzyme